MGRPPPPNAHFVRGFGGTSVRRHILVASLSALVAACGHPTNSSPTYAGDWTGTTDQGRPISFTISSSETVTTITVGHSFNSCSGSQTFSDLNVSIAPNVQCIPGPCSGSLASYRAIHYGSGNLLGGAATSINGVFLSHDRVEGQVMFSNLPVCGSATASWAAIKK